MIREDTVGSKLAPEKCALQGLYQVPGRSQAGGQVTREVFAGRGVPRSGWLLTTARRRGWALRAPAAS